MQGGGIVFGPDRAITRSICRRRYGSWRSARRFRQKRAAGELVVLDRAELGEPKTKLLASQSDEAGLEQATRHRCG